MKRNLAKLSAFVIVLALVACTLVGCNVVKQHTITYNLNFEGAAAPTTEKLNEGASVTFAPTREGYTFKGWFTDEQCTAAIAEDYKVTADATLYASWEKVVQNYYLCGSFNGYAVPNSTDDYKMKLVEGSETVYYIEVTLTAEMRDPTYDGHWYKVSKGTWDANDLFGTESYFVQPAPVKKTDGGDAIGLGSIWINVDGKLTVIFDSENKVIYDTVGTIGGARIYGDFNSETNRGADWSLKDNEALVLTDADADGVWEGELTLPAYTGEGDGYMLSVVTKFGYAAYLPWHGYSAIEQYLFSGEAGGMGRASYVKPTAETTYHFYYNETTHQTDYVYALAAPTLYGDFNSWNIFDSGTLMVKDGDVYKATITLPAYTGDGDGWSLILCVSAKYYAAWNVTGASEQYIFDGTASAMGSASKINNTVETTYEFTYNPQTHVTTYVAK